MNTLEFRVVDQDAYRYTRINVQMTGTAYRCLPRKLPYTDWIEQYAGRPNAELLADATADADGDGIHNLVEFGNGTYALTPNAPSLQTPRMVWGIVDGVWERYMVWKFICADDADVTIEPRISKDLLHWTPARIISAEPLPNGQKEVQARTDGPYNAAEATMMSIKYGTK